MKREYFNVEIFIKIKLKDRKHIETQELSNWIEYSLRYIQKWAEKNKIPFIRIHGIKHYSWDKKSLIKFSEWYNKRTKLENNIPNQTTKKLNFKTIKEIVTENIITCDEERKTKIKSKMRRIQVLLK
jgi:hypothetical protein